MKPIQDLIDGRLTKLLNDALTKQTPIYEYLASLRKEAMHTSMYWFLVERSYQLAQQQGVFLNSESFIKLVSQEARLSPDEITLAPPSPLPPTMLKLGEGQALRLGTVGLLLKQMDMTKSLRSLAYNVVRERKGLVEIGFLKQTEIADLQDFSAVFKEELRTRYGDEEYISIS